jgi:glutamate-1-semialdehyde 2,1-aminomutase
MILGHAPAPVIRAITRAAKNGTSYGAPTALETELARLIAAAIPSMEQVRLVSSGTEAVMSAIRLARACTKRTKVLKFDGCYHGHADYLLSKAGSGVATLGLPDSPGVPADFARLTLTAPYNDIRSVQEVVRQHHADLACIIVEPVAGNMGVVPPAPDFLPALRKLTRAHGILLIFDEVITGFRLDLGGAQTWYGVVPDLCVFAKAIGAGVALSALAGRRDLMSLIGMGEVVHAGTMNGNPLALAACNICLERLSRDSAWLYPALRRRGQRLRAGLENILGQTVEHVLTQGEGAVFQVAFMEAPARNYRDTLAADRQAYSDFALAMLDEGVLLLPDGRWYVSAAHSDGDIEETLEAARRAARG